MISAGREIFRNSGFLVNLWVADGLSFQGMAQKRFSVILALNWTMLNENFHLAPFIDSYLPYLADDGVIILDVIDRSYSAVPNNEFNTSDWQKPIAQRRLSEYKTRISWDEIARVLLNRNLLANEVFHEKQIVPKNVLVIKRFNTK